jgi:hypothetical protein
MCDTHGESFWLGPPRDFDPIRMKPGKCKTGKRSEIGGKQRDGLVKQAERVAPLRSKRRVRKWFASAAENPARFVVQQSASGILEQAGARVGRHAAKRRPINSRHGSLPVQIQTAVFTMKNSVLSGDKTLSHMACSRSIPPDQAPNSIRRYPSCCCRRLTMEVCI